MKKVYYIVLTDFSSMSYPEGRFTDESAAKGEVKRLREKGLPATYITAGRYRELTGRNASADYYKM